MSSHWTVILNPRASSGRAAKHWEKIAQLLRDEQIPFELYRTEYPRHAEELTRQALLRGERKICGVGGDGTINEIANAILSQDAVNTLDIVIAQIPVGTGNDWGRTLGIPSDYKAAVRLLKKDKTFVQDAGKVAYIDDEGKEADRWFVNMAGLGYDAFVGITANERKSKGKGGKMGYMIALLSCLMKYEPKKITFQTEKEALQTPMFSMVVGVCRYNGGGMMQAPAAIPDDGILNATLIGEISKLEVIRQIRNLFSGAFVSHKAVSQFAGKSFEVTSSQKVLLEVDGENIGRAPARFTIRDKCLKVIVK